MPIEVEDPAPANTVILIEDLQGPLMAADMAKHSAKDREISLVMDWVKRGWPSRPLGNEFKPYKARQNELSTIQGCLLWGSSFSRPLKESNNNNFT